jgi:cytochrome c biogenesis protein
VRCDAAGQENYQDGTPKRWWSDLTIVSGSSDVYQKQIVVNDPLVYRGIRFYQASYWVSGDINRLKLIAVSPSSGAEKEVTLPAGGDVRIDDQTTARITRFIPDYYLSDNNIAQRSAEPVNPAIEIVLSRAGQNTVTWVFPAGQNQYRSPVPLPYELRFQQLELKPWTGLEVSYEPGQWAVWSGCVLMALALVMTFYFAHTRLWAVPLVDKRGRLVLWVGSNASKPTPQSESIFRKVAAQIEADLETDHADAVTAIHDKKRINPVADAVQRDAAVRV